jgi:hypothetical protein
MSKEQRRALILYATMTKNTEKIAKAFEKAFRHYNWDVTLFKMTMKPADWEGMQEKLYFDDYDVVCLGSPIVAGYPLTVVNKVFSLGAGGALEKEIQSNIDKGETTFDEKMEANSMKDKSAIAKGPQPGARPKLLIGARWRREEPLYRGIASQHPYRPKGVVFTTYGGGFYGSDEAIPTLESLKMFLQLNGCDNVGTFACCGKEFGPAGLEKGQKPMVMPGQAELPDPVMYPNEDGEELQGSYFFHYAGWEHPSDRDVMKAYAMICDMVEDYFLSYHGDVWDSKSQYVSIS